MGRALDPGKVEMTVNGSEDPRERIMAAVVDCVGAGGLRGASMSAVAERASVSRTTIYRYFPDGRSQLLTETATWEIGRFWAKVADAVEEFATLEDRLVVGLLVGRRMIARSRILSNISSPEIGELLEVSQPAEPLVRSVVRAYMRSQLEEEARAGRVRPHLDMEIAADYLARMSLSWMANSPGLDLGDEEAVRHVVRTQFLAAVVA